MNDSSIPHNSNNFNPQIRKGLRVGGPTVGQTVDCAACDRPFTWTANEPAIYFRTRANGVSIGPPIAAVLCPHCFKIANRNEGGLRRITKRVQKQNADLFGAIEVAAAFLYGLVNGGGNG